MREACDLWGESGAREAKGGTMLCEAKGGTSAKEVQSGWDSTDGWRGLTVQREGCAFTGRDSQLSKLPPPTSL